jgi:transglutaminase-like putative cysteine protease
VLDAESTVLTAGTPLGANIDTTIETPKGFSGDIEEMRSRRALNTDDTYNAIGSESHANLQQLLTAGTTYPDWVTQKYLQLPNELPARVREETARIIKEKSVSSPYEIAKVIEDYLRTLPYDLTVPSPPPGRDAADYLLFDSKRGYFDYQATAMCVMLRTQGVPCRIAVGQRLQLGGSLLPEVRLAELQPDRRPAVRRSRGLRRKRLHTLRRQPGTGPQQSL